MANERLRQAISQAGLAPEQFAELIEVDPRTVERWLQGRTPYPRFRVKIAKALGRAEHELWPDAAVPPPGQDVRGEIQSAWAHATDLGAPDWRSLLKDAVEQVDLLGLSLIEILQSPDLADTLKAKAEGGCLVRIMIAAPDSTFVYAAAQQLGQDEQDYIGRTELQREIETARGHLEPLIHLDGIDLREVYSERAYTILRFDERMLIRHDLYGSPPNESPLICLRRRTDGGLFDQFAAHQQAIANDAQPLQPNPELYPDPRQQPERYKPVTQETFEQERQADRQPHVEPGNSQRPLEEVRAQLRRQTQ